MLTYARNVGRRRQWAGSGQLCVALFALLANLSCSASRTPHENFVEGAMTAMVGQDIRRDLDYDKFQQSTLPGGNIEFRWVRIFPPGEKPCTLIYEVNPRSYIIVRATYDGSERDCVLPP